MNTLIKSTAESAIGAFSGNRMVRYACDEAPNLRKFNTHDYIAIGTGTAIPVLASHFLKASLCGSLCVAVGFHSVTGLAISGGLTYLLHKKEKSDLDKAKKAEQEKFIKFIDTTIKQAHDDIAYIFSDSDYDTKKYKEKFSEEFDYYKRRLIQGNRTKEKTTKEVSETADLLKAVRKKYQIFKEYLDQPNGFSEQVASIYFEDTTNLMKNSDDNLFKELRQSIQYHGSSYAYKKIKEQWKANQERKQLNDHFKIPTDVHNAFGSFNASAQAIRNDIIAIENDDTEAIFQKRVNKKCNRYGLVYHPDKNPNNLENAHKAIAFINQLKVTTLEDAKKISGNL